MKTITVTGYRGVARIIQKFIVDNEREFSKVVEKWVKENSIESWSRDVR